MPPRLVNYFVAKARWEKQYLVAAMKEFDGNVVQASRAMGIARRSLQLKLAAFEIDVERMRNVARRRKRAAR